MQSTIHIKKNEEEREEDGAKPAEVDSLCVGEALLQLGVILRDGEHSPDGAAYAVDAGFEHLGIVVDNVLHDKKKHERHYEQQFVQYDGAPCERSRTAQLYEHEPVERNGNHVSRRNHHPVELVEFCQRLYEEEVFQTLQADNEHHYSHES